MYFVESVLESASTGDFHGASPIILLPGSWDAKNGDYSERLIRLLLLREGAPSVLEAHYRYRNQDGYFDPDAFAEDMALICRERAAPPTVVGLCFACPFILESLLKACSDGTLPHLAGVLVIGHSVPGFLTMLGAGTLGALTSKKLAAAGRHLLFNGHPHTPGNNVRLEAWFKESRLLAAMRDERGIGIPQPFPVPVEALHFELDFATEEARKITQRIFSAVESDTRIPGGHRSLCRRTPADELIALFYRRMQAIQVAGKDGNPNSASSDTSKLAERGPSRD